VLALFDRREVRAWLDGRRTRVLWLVDAVHWLKRKWRQAASRGPEVTPPEVDLDLSSTALRDELRADMLRRRLGPSEVAEPLHQLGIDGADEKRGFAILRDLLELLASGDTSELTAIALSLEQEVRRTHVSRPSLGTVARQIVDRVGTDGYRFRIDTDGATLRPDPAPPSAPEAEEPAPPPLDTALLTAWHDVLLEHGRLSLADVQSLRLVGRDVDLASVHAAAQRKSPTLTEEDLRTATQTLETNGTDLRAVIVQALYARHVLGLDDTAFDALADTGWPIQRSAIAYDLLDLVGEVDAYRALMTSRRDGAAGLRAWADAAAALIGRVSSTGLRQRALDVTLANTAMRLQAGSPKSKLGAEWIVHAFGEPALAVLQPDARTVGELVDRLLVAHRGTEDPASAALEAGLSWLGVALAETGPEDPLLSGHWTWRTAPARTGSSEAPAILLLTTPSRAVIPRRPGTAPVTVAIDRSEVGPAVATLKRWLSRLPTRTVVVDLGEMTKRRAIQALLREVRDAGAETVVAMTKPSLLRRLRNDAAVPEVHWLASASTPEELRQSLRSNRLLPA
jgi:hypothetical protein